jgi:hypothetical protein
MGQVRISIGNLAVRMVEAETSDTAEFGLLNSAAYRKGNHLYAALGGAAELKPLGRQFLRNTFGARDFEGDDARFTVDDDKIEEVFAFFKKRDLTMIEADPTREIIEELVLEKIPGMGTILSPEDAALIRVQFLTTIEQPEGGTTSARERAEMPTRRLFHLFEISVPVDVSAKLLRHPSVRIFTREELATTNGGRAKGTTHDGFAIADNIGLI